MTSVRDRGLAILQGALNDDNAQFHLGQQEAVDALVEKRGRVLVVQRTGWGKSAVYFIATRLLRELGYGPTIIMSPLLALMRNQIDAAARFGVNLGSTNSSNDRKANAESEQRLIDGDLDAVIVAPEQLAKPSFREDVLGQLTDDIGLLVVDEAHCISDWGHDFRPDYKRISTLLRDLPANMPVLATTATANDRVMEDVVAQLGDDIKVIRGPLTRTSLHLQTIEFPRRSQRLAWLADHFDELDGSGIIYTATIRDAQLVANWLKSRNHAVECYHSRLPADERVQLEAALLGNRLRALVSTSALGMGFDKPDLAFVVHFQSPGSVVSYYQQVGRAGRAIPKARGILLSGSEDEKIQRHFIDNAFPQEWLVRKILGHIEDAEDGLANSQIQARVNARPKKTEDALKFLAAESPAPVRMDPETRRYSRTLIDYELPHESIERLSQRKREEWQRIQSYVVHEDCLMQMLAGELDDSDAMPCGRCQNCAPEDALPKTFEHATGVAAGEFLVDICIEIAPKSWLARSRAAAEGLFPQYGFPFSLKAKKLQHESGRALCYWGEAGWGEIAMHGKHEGEFDPRLVGAAAKLIRERWSPDPFPEWLTFVPSHEHPELVPAFAEKLAATLGISCHDVVQKVKKNLPQKSRENTFHRCRNLDGVFEIHEPLPEGPTLLVDDAYDSGWTFAVIAALLRRAGSGPVIPFAIMSTSSA